MLDCTQSSWSALTTACRKRNEEIVEVLVKAGASVDLTKKVRRKACRVRCFPKSDSFIVTGWSDCLAHSQLPRITESYGVIG